MAPKKNNSNITTTNITTSSSQSPEQASTCHYTDEELLRYMAASPEAKLQWLQEAWQMTCDFLPKDRIEIYQKMRRE